MKTIILISRKMRSGKNQFADYLKAHLESLGNSVEMDLFARDLKDGCSEDFEYMTKQINAQVEKIKSYINAEGLDSYDEVIKLLNDLKATKENFYEDKTLITRLLLQTYGTQIFRDRVDENYWVNQVLERYRVSSKDFTIVTDARFENEVEWVKTCVNTSVITIRINRNFEDSTLLQHPSETGLDEYKKWNYIIDNNGTLEDLSNATKYIASTLSTICGAFND